MQVRLMQKLLGCVLIISALHKPVMAFDLALDASVGALMPKGEFGSPNLDFSGHLWYKFDQMVFFGASSGIQTIGKDRHIPLMGAAWIRLPLGGQILPVATGDIGYHLGDDPQFAWRVGGGLDIKNGDRTSLLVLSGFERFARLGGYYYIRGGLLLEF